MAKLPISLVIITKNEAQNLGRCLASADIFSEIIVVDSGSTDATLEIARRFGAEVFVEDWKGFGRQKQSATDKAHQDWVLSLDADEALSPALKEELLELFTQEPKNEAYRIPRLSFHMGRWIRHGGWYPDYQTRLFNRRKARWTEAELHEKVIAQNTGRLKNHLEHFVFRDLSHQVEANNRYSSLGAGELRAKGQKFSLVRILLKPTSKFVETYLWKRGFLDGLPGFVIAVGAAYSMFLRQAKLWELQSKTSQKKPS
jgi:glycosyltransferase involved in cell wall biosynthesis